MRDAFLSPVCSCGFIADNDEEMAEHINNSDDYDGIHEEVE